MIGDRTLNKYNKSIERSKKITPFVEMAKITRKKFTPTGRKKKTTTVRLCHCKPTCNRKLAKKTRKVHYKRLTEEEMGYFGSSETCSQNSSGDDSTDVRFDSEDENIDFSFDEGVSIHTASAGDSIYVSGQHFRFTNESKLTSGIAKKAAITKKTKAMMFRLLKMMAVSEVEKAVRTAKVKVETA